MHGMSESRHENAQCSAATFLLQTSVANVNYYITIATVKQQLSNQKLRYDTAHDLKSTELILFSSSK